MLVRWFQLPVFIFFGLVALITKPNEAFAQEFRKSEGNIHVGLQMGFSGSTVYGNELEKSTIRRGSIIGMSYRQILNRNLHLRAELNASLRGSRFSHTEENHYNSITFTCLDLPIGAMINVSGTDKNKFITIAAQPSVLLHSDIIVNPDIRPKFQNEGFQRMDFAAVLGFHVDTYYMGFEPAIRIGLMNINDNLNLPDVLPATGKNQTIKNITFDLRVYF